MRKKLFGLLIVLLAGLTSCLDDGEGYSLGNYWVDLGIMETQGEVEVVRLDNGALLFPVAGWPGFHKLETGDRVMVDYTIVGDKSSGEGGDAYYVRINSVTELLKKGILDLTPANEDSIGNDPVVVRDMWVSKNQLLNFRIRYYGNDRIHFINLVKQPGVPVAEDQPIQLELRHNRNGDREVFPMTAFVSFELDSLRIAGLDSVRFEVRAVDYDDHTRLYSGMYRY